jgi:hypothetical protein
MRPQPVRLPESRAHAFDVEEVLGAERETSQKATVCAVERDVVLDAERTGRILRDGR